MLLSTVMNLFWMYLVYNQAKRAITRRFGVPSTTDKDDNFATTKLLINADNCVESADTSPALQQALLVK